MELSYTPLRRPHPFPHAPKNPYQKYRYNDAIISSLNNSVRTIFIPQKKEHDVWPNCKRVWHTCKGNLIQPLQMQQVSNRLGHSLHQEPRTRMARGSATSVLTPVIFDSQHQSIYGLFLWARLFESTEVDAKKSKGESQTANYLVKDCQEKGAGWMNWNITNGGALKTERTEFTT